MISALQFVPSLAVGLPSDQGISATTHGADFGRTIGEQRDRMTLDRVLSVADRVDPSEERTARELALDPELIAGPSHLDSHRPWVACGDLANYSFGEARERIQRLQDGMQSGTIDSTAACVELLNLQTMVQQYAFRTELSTKIVDQIASGVRNVLQTQA
jgi:hypothetical protein